MYEISPDMANAILNLFVIGLFVADVIDSVIVAIIRKLSVD